MNIYLMRHGDSSISEDDDTRPLSKKGEKEVHDIARFLSANNTDIRLIFHSPKIRAIQTATIINDHIGHVEMIMRKDLTPSSSVSQILLDLNQSHENILVVGHMPFMGKLVNKLLSFSEDMDVVFFKTSTVVCLERLNSQWIINWVINPSLII